MAAVPGKALAQPVLQFDGHEDLTVRFLVAPDPTGRYSVMAQETVPSPNQGGPVVWAADNNVGTPLDVVDNTGTLANHRVFSAFGQDVHDSDPSLSYWVGFAGGHGDPNTGLVNDHHRWYDAAAGKWISEDPEGFGADDTDLLRYVGNSPIEGIDATGLDPQINPAPPFQGPPPNPARIFIAFPPMIVFRDPSVTDYNQAYAALQSDRALAVQISGNLRDLKRAMDRPATTLAFINFLGEAGASDAFIRIMFSIPDVNTFKASLEADIAALRLQMIPGELTLSYILDAEMRLSDKIDSYMGLK
ncbi:MAG: RHS repeat domain-containing protein, partial [Pirellulales bacterium]